MTIAAFFDMDETVLTVDSGTTWVKFLHERGELGNAMLARALWWGALYKLALLDVEALASRLVASMQGQPEDELVAKIEVFHRERLEQAIAVGARRAIERHRERGDHVVLLTGATQYAAELVAQGLGIDHVLCSRVEVEDGRFTGRLASRCFGWHKVTMAERFAAERGIDLARSWFYSDSYNDLPMLSRVGKAVVVNPDGRLLRHAWRRRWPVERWS